MAPGCTPAQGETAPNYTGPQADYDFLNTDGKYSWLKAPRYNDAADGGRPAGAHGGGLRRRSSARAATGGRRCSQSSGCPARRSSPRSAGWPRAASRRVVIAEQLAGWIGQLEANMNGGNLAIHDKTRWDPATWPAEASGWGATEAPRGALGHWVRIKNGKIENYQAVVATIWNGSPRDARGQRGPWEQALIGTPVVDPARAGRNPAHHPLLRSLHGLRRARGGRGRQRSHAHPGRAVD